MMFSFNYLHLLLVARGGSALEGEGWVEFMQNQTSLFLSVASSLIPSLLPCSDISLHWCPEAMLVQRCLNWVAPTSAGPADMVAD